MKRRIATVLAGTALSLSGCATMSSQDTASTVTANVSDPLADGFAEPPMSARPRAWWHWMNGNVTKDGIAKDLEWMKWVGLGGLQNFDANLATPQIVDKRLVYMEPDWQDAFRFAGARADELGLEFAIAASPGWSETGGPWVPPKDGLKKLVWSETIIAGGKPFSGKLTQPPSTTGPFQELSKGAGLDELMAGGPDGKKPAPPTYYADVKVLAFPVNAVPALPSASFSINNGQSVDFAPAFDGDITSAVTLERTGLTQPLFIQLDYAVPQTVRSARIFMPGVAYMFLGALVNPRLEASVDGKSWQKVADLPGLPVPTTSSFAPVTATHFRVVFEPGEFGITGLAPPTEGLIPMGPATLAQGANELPLQLAELELSGRPVIDHFEAKAGFEIEKDYYHFGTVDDGAEGIAPAQVIDLTDRMQADGTLDWTPPGGTWKVLRLGYSLLGTTNHPATPEATGLEVDKYDGPAVRRYLEHYLGLYADTLGKSLAEQDMLDAILTDSIEVGAANWTPAMIEQFTRLRGYDPTPWLPALTGTLVGSREQSDRFLYDYRRTLADLLSSEHYGTVAEVAHENGLIVYGEALENGRPSLGDDLTMRSHADIPMSAMWTHPRERGPNYAHVADIKGAASVANIYGRDFVAAESMTSAMAPWDHVPSYLKRIIDLEFVNGVNRPVIHTSVHQPVDDKVPGLSLFIFGQYFNRHESWAPLARPWVDYMSRTAFLLQQGRNVADVAYFYGEDAPPAALYQSGWMTDAPQSYAFDFVSADAITGVLSSGPEGEIVSSGGAKYKAIYLGGSSHMMTLPVLEKLASLVRGGAVLIGAKPETTPSLADDQAAFDELASALWSGETGRGKVIKSSDIDASLALAGIAPAFRFNGASEGARIPFVEREWDGGRLFFLSNPSSETEVIQARFRVTGKRPELWDAVSGTNKPVSYREEAGETVISLTLAGDDAVFVLFREDSDGDSRVVAEPEVSATSVIDGPWQVKFQEGRRGPEALSMPRLVRWDQSDDPALKYFSGMASYSTSFSAPADWSDGEPLWLDLGTVHDLAEVWVNGQRVGGLWRAPWRLDIGQFVRSGSNDLEIQVANKWVNRLIGDAQEGAEKKTFTPLPTYRPDATLRPSGLVGPVTLAVER